MNKIADYLQEHLEGEVLTDADVRRYYSTDGGIFEITPNLVVYPKNTQDVRKAVRFSWQLAEKGHHLPITPRGRGSDQGGGAIGGGMMIVFPAHMKRMLEFDGKKRLARVQPGLNFASFQDTMHSHGLFLPPYPASIDFATLGGAIGNNTAGEKSVQFGAMRNYVQNLEVVLANGEVIQTGRLSKREVEARKGLTTFEGEVYRQLDGLMTDNWDLIQKEGMGPDVSKNSAGYAISMVKHKDGSMDLTPLFVGSQGTLGVVVEAILKLEQYSPGAVLFKIDIDEVDKIETLVPEIMQLKPSALEVVDKHLLNLIDKISPNRLKGIVESPYPELILLAEFDEYHEGHQIKKAKSLEKLLKKEGYKFQATQDYDEQQKLWAIRHSSAAVIWHVNGNKKALPIIEDAIVPKGKFKEFLEIIYKLFEKYNLDVAVWGHAGDANLHLQPFLDLSVLGDRQKIFKIMDEYYADVLKLGGSTTAEHSDGRIRAPYLPKVYGPEMYQLFQDVKKIFDPYSILNPGVKVNVQLKDLVPILRHEYSLKHLSDHLPRT